MATPKHIVFHVPNAWDTPDFRIAATSVHIATGHMKPLLAFVARVAERRPDTAVVMTILTSGVMFPKIESELARMPSEASGRINIIDIVGPNEGNLRNTTQFGPVFGTLWHRQMVECLSTKRTFSGLPQPTLAVMSAVCDYALEGVRASAGATFPVLVWTPSPMSAMLRMFGPENLGGLGDFQAKVAAETTATGKSVQEVASAVFRKSTGEIVRVPGLPDAYDYEFHPQEDHQPAATAMLLGVHRLLLSTDGMINVTCSVFEGESITAGRRWLESSGKDLYIVGPLENAPPAAKNELNEGSPTMSEEDAQVLSFLDRMHATYGDHSTLLIAFGSLHYPKDPAKLHAFVSELLDIGTPFVWSHASHLAVVPPELAQRIEASESAYHSRWVPQLAVLAHPATGWFVCHGGWNSMQEALALRVPMVFWPFVGDQPHNAALMAFTHRAAFELLSVREGDGARPPLRVVQGGPSAKPIDFTFDGVRAEVRELLALERGEEGRRVRENAEKLGAAMDASWQDGGEANVQLAAFMDKYVDTA